MNDGCVRISYDIPIIIDKFIRIAIYSSFFFFVDPAVHVSIHAVAPKTSATIAPAFIHTKNSDTLPSARPTTRPNPANAPNTIHIRYSTGMFYLFICSRGPRHSSHRPARRELELPVSCRLAARPSFRARARAVTQSITSSVASTITLSMSHSRSDW
jgi:hypothetical protein